MRFPDPVCQYGYSDAQVAALIGEARMPEFHRYMELKASAVCSGMKPCDEAHGPVSYPHDVERFDG